MVALASGFAVCSVIAIESPDLRQLAIPPVVRRHRQTRVVSTLLDDAWPPGRGLTSSRVADKRRSTVVAIQSVAVGVAPRGDCSALNWIIHRCQLFASISREHSEPLGSGQNVAGAIAVVLGVVGAGRHAGAQIRAGSVLGSRCGLGRKFRLAVAVEVVHRHLGIVRPGANIRSQVDAPQLLASQRIPVDHHVVSDARLRIVLGIRWRPLEHDVDLAVAIEIPWAGVVCVRARYRLERDANVLLRPRRHRIRLLALGPADHSGHRVL